MIDFATMTAEQLNDWYENKVGYRPQVDDPNLSDDDLRMFCREMAVLDEEVEKETRR